MGHFSRLVLVAIASGSMALTFPALAESAFLFFPQDFTPYLQHSAAPGYLGVGLRDIDSQRASALGLKQPGGAEIVSVDRDGPAGSAGLQVHDVILAMNGHTVGSVEQVRQMIQQTPVGTTVTFIISRDGQPQSVAIQLADEQQVEQRAWSRHYTVPDPADAVPSEGFFSAASHSFGSGLFSIFTPSSTYVGAEVDALSPQLAGYFGCKGSQGLLVKSVDENSPAAAAGLKAGDIILKVNDGPVATRSDWLKQMHINRGKQVQLTVMRNRRQQTMTMMAGEAKKKSEMVWPRAFR